MGAPGGGARGSRRGARGGVRGREERVLALEVEVALIADVADVDMSDAPRARGESVLSW